MRQEYLLAAAGIGGALGLVMLPKLGVKITGISSPIQILKGSTLATTVTFTNTGAQQWTYYVGLSFLDSSNLWHDIPTQSITVNPGAQASVTLSSIATNGVNVFNTVGTYGARASVWKVNPPTDESNRLADTNGIVANVVKVVDITASMVKVVSDSTQWYP